MNYFSPINFKKWVDQNRDKLKPPIGNKLIFPAQGFIIMAVGGPNSRKDYHFSDSPEFFYQLEGEMCLKLTDGKNFEDVPLKAGDMFLLTPQTGHSPRRFSGSLGLVFEIVRKPEEFDHFCWYCETCNTQLHDVGMNVGNIETDLQKAFKIFYDDETLRTCKQCSKVWEVPK